MKKMNKYIVGYSKGVVIMGVGTAIGAGVQSQLPAGSPSLTSGFSAMGSMMPMVGTTMMGGHALRMVKKLNKQGKGGY